MNEGSQEPRSSDIQESVNAAMEHVAETQSAPRPEVKDVRPFLSRPWVVVSVFGLFVGVVAWNISVWNAPPAPLSPEEAARAEQITLFTASRLVEAFREEEGRLPASLAVVGLAEAGLVYQVQGENYTLRVSPARGGAVLQSSQGDSALLAHLENLAREGGSR